MQEKIENGSLKTIRKCVRLSEDMNKLFLIVAKEHKTTVGKFLRDAGLIMAEMSVDQKEFLELIKDKDELKVQKKFQTLFEENKDLVVNGIQNLYETLSERIDKIEKLIEIFIYVYLYHTPEIDKGSHENAVKSGLKRRKRVLEICNREWSKAREEKGGN